MSMSPSEFNCFNQALGAPQDLGPTPSRIYRRYVTGLGCKWKVRELKGKWYYQDPHQSDVWIRMKSEPGYESE